jgi:hypothetical protein
MALSDYLTGDEWDACFYTSMGQRHADNFGDSMDKTIKCLLDSGYRFPGLTEQGNKKEQVCDGINAPKCCIFLGNPYHADVLQILDNGRNFLKIHAPKLVDETDADWKAQMDKAKEEVNNG